MNDALEAQFTMYCRVCGRLDNNCMMCILTNDKCISYPVMDPYFLVKPYDRTSLATNLVVGCKDRQKNFDPSINLTVRDLTPGEVDELTVRILMNQLENDDVSGA